MFLLVERYDLAVLKTIIIIIIIIIKTDHFRQITRYISVQARHIVSIKVV